MLSQDALDKDVILMMLKICDEFGEMELTIFPDRAAYLDVYGHAEIKGHDNLMKILNGYEEGVPSGVRGNDTRHKHEFLPLLVRTDRSIERHDPRAYNALHVQTNIFCRLLMMVMPYLINTTGVFFLLFFS